MRLLAKWASSRMKTVQVDGVASDLVEQLAARTTKP
jgi:hypothetical protein